MVTDSAVRGGRRLDRLEAVFDDEQVVANAGVVLAATLCDRLGLEALVDDCVALADSSGGLAGGRDSALAGARDAARRGLDRRL